MSPPSFHLIPESCTAITTSGRPVSRRQAISMLIPLTPWSSFVLPVTAGSVVQKFVLAYFHFSPLQLPALPLISFASGMHPSGMPELSQRFGSAGDGSSARAASAQKSVRPAATASGRWRIDGTPPRTHPPAPRGPAGRRHPAAGDNGGPGPRGANRQH